MTLWSNDTVSGRTYAGESASDRAGRRRRQLLDAGLELFGTAGYRATTVRLLCREARVSDRYFYEQFDSTEDLLVAVYDECTARLEAAALTALGDGDGDVGDLARRGLDAFLALVEEDPGWRGSCGSRCWASARASSRRTCPGCSASAT